jgi:hypothetical protein
MPQLAWHHSSVEGRHASMKGGASRHDHRSASQSELEGQLSRRCSPRLSQIRRLTPAFGLHDVPKGTGFAWPRLWAGMTRSRAGKLRLLRCRGRARRQVRARRSMPAPPRGPGPAALWRSSGELHNGGRSGCGSVRTAADAVFCAETPDAATLSGCLSCRARHEPGSTSSASVGSSASQ